MNPKIAANIMKELGSIVPEKSIYRYYSCFRNIVSVYTDRLKDNLVFSGTVEIDETQIGTRRRGSHGRIPKRGLNVFG